MNENESLRIISTTINDAHGKEKIAQHGLYFLIWGWAAFLAAVAQYILVTSGSLKYHFFPWLIMAALASTISYLYGEQKGFYSPAFFGKSIGQLWMGYTMMVSILVLVGTLPIEKQLTLSVLYGMIILVTGLSTFFSGLLLHSTYFKTGGIVASIGGFFSFFVSFDFAIVLLAFATLSSFIIPGYLYKRSYAQKA